MHRVRRRDGERLKESRLLFFSGERFPEFPSESEGEREHAQGGVRRSLNAMRNRMPNLPSSRERVREPEARVTREGEFFCLEGKSCRVKTDISPRFAQELTAFAEGIEGLLSGMFPQPEGRGKILVTVYSSRERYLKDHHSSLHRGEAKGKKKDGKWTVPEIATYADGPRWHEFEKFPKARLSHEIAHAVTINSFGRKPPMWFAEGIAGYFETWKPDRDSEQNMGEHVRDSYFLAKMKQLFEKDPSREEWLKPVLETKGSRFNADRTGRNYAVSASFVSYLMSSPQGQEKFRNFMKDVREGKPLIVNFAEEEERWQKFVRQSEPALHMN